MTWGRRHPQASMVAFVDLEEHVPLDQPGCAIKRFADAALAELGSVLGAMDAASERPSIPPERLLKASLKLFRPKDATPDAESPHDRSHPTMDFRREKRANAMPVSTIDPQSRLAKKSAGKEAKRCHAGHALMENRRGLLVDFRITTTNGTAERDAILVLLQTAVRGFHPKTVGADTG